MQEGYILQILLPRETHRDENIVHERKQDREGSAQYNVTSPRMGNVSYEFCFKFKTPPSVSNC